MLVMVLAGSWMFFWRSNGLLAGDAILYTALLLAAIPTLGPGYATQYIYWFLPLLVATCACQPRWWRSVVAGFATIAVVTYLIEYALLPEYGYYLFYLWPAAGSSGASDDGLLSLYVSVDSELGRTLLRLPIFLAYLALLALGGGLLLSHLPRDRHRTFSMRFYALMVLVSLGLAFGAIAITAGLRNKSPSDSGPSSQAATSPLDPASRKHWETAVLNNLAWKLATSPDASIRNGPLAVKAAGRACIQTQYQQPVLVGTLAAAYAEAGRFNEAAATAQKACDMAASLGDTNLVQINQSLASLYQTRQPYHEPLPEPLGVGHQP